MTVEYKAEEILEGIKAIPNPNAAAKGFLKQQVSKGSPLEKFVKSLRKIFGDRNDKKLELFVNNHSESHIREFMVFNAHGHAGVFQPLTEKVFEKYADQFNETFELDDQEELNILDEKKFKEIVGEVRKMALEEFKGGELPQGSFMLHSLYQFVFEDQVWDYILQNCE